jgi:5-methyltetrahydrofolate--homocysteine methyltransferase
VDGDANMVRELTQAALDAGAKPEEILNRGLIVGMNEVGRRFKADECYIPEVLISARAMHAGLDLLKPLLSENDVEPVATVVLGTVAGDLHDIGKNLVGMMLEGGGFKVIDLGVDVSPGKFLDAVKEYKPDMIAMSALLTTTMPSMQKTIKEFEAAGVRSQVKIVIGGAPITAGYSRQIGADGFAPDAASAVDLAKQLLGIS